MNMFEVMKALGVDNAADFIKRIVLKNIMHYAPEADISNFDEANIKSSIIKWLESEADENRCRELGIFPED